MLLSGCNQWMAEQPKYVPLAASDFFKDGQAARPLPPGTVARGFERLDVAFYEGKRVPTEPGVRMAELVGPGRKAPVMPTLAEIARVPYVDVLPVPLTRELLQRGQERYTIYCAVCHGPDGTGDGQVVERGFTRPPTFHDDRLRQAPAGYVFDIITHGFGSMPDYAEQIPPQDRWAIVAYLRALQLSRHARLVDLPEAVRTATQQELEKADGQRP